MFIASLLAVLSILPACGQDAALAEGHTADTDVFDFEVYESESEAETVLAEAEEAVGSVDSLRCFLLHMHMVREGESPDGWEQPDMEVYEDVKVPCSLLPGFVDPRREALEAIDAKREEVQIAKDGGKLPPKR